MTTPMTREISGWSIVLLGAWNPAILSPGWVARHVLKSEGTQVEMFLGMGVADQRRFRFPDEGVMYVVEPSRLSIMPLDALDRMFVRVEQVARGVLEVLPHTPVRGAGVNYLFNAPTGGAPLIDEVLSLADAARIEGLGLRPSKTQVTRTLTGLAGSGKPVLNLKFVSDLESGRLNVDFNYHYAVKDAGEAHDRLEGAFLGLQEHASRVLAAYDIEVDDGDAKGEDA